MQPVLTNNRYQILDILRGIALIGICIANFGELSLYTFQPALVTTQMPTAATDRIVSFFQYLIIDGKFYTLFSLLFGVGFSIILSNCERDGRNGLRVFYRRMFILLAIGMAHMILLWAGDILVLYAALGMLLPAFRNLPDRKLLTAAAVLLLFPIVMEAFTAATDGRFSLIIPVNRAVEHFHAGAGITWDNFGTWLRDSHSYSDIVKFNLAGFFIRLGEFIEGDRAFKVLGLFLLGLYAGRKKFYTDTENNRRLIRKTMTYSFIIGIPLSLLYAYKAVTGFTLGAAADSAVYIFSVFPTGIAYACSIYLWYYRKPGTRWKYIAAPGRMALSNYIGQSVMGMILFYGVGFSLGATMGLAYVDLIAAGVFILQVVISYTWLHYMSYGPLEWIWRMLTYGKILKLKKTL